MDKIDWNKPLELMDGTPVVLSDKGFNGGPNPDRDGDYWIEWNGMRECSAPDGSHVTGGKGYQVRNRVEPAVTAEPEIEVGKISLGETPTLRDQFAMAALTGYIANNEFGFMTADEVAGHCYATADAMLKARKVNNEAD